MVATPTQGAIIPTRMIPRFDQKMFIYINMSNKRIDIERCNDSLVEFFPQVNECKGYSMKSPAHVTMKDINHWFRLANKLADWTQDLLCAWGGHKIAMIDYDYWPNKPIGQDEAEEILIRYLMVAKCGIQVLYASDGDGSIYYDKKYWKEALLLHMYHEGLISLPNIPRRRDIFQAILLGYSNNSIYEYTQDVDIPYRVQEFLLYNHGLDSDILKNLNVGQVKNKLQKLWNESSDELKTYIYEQIYGEVYTRAKLQEFNKHFKQMQDFIATALRVIEENEL